LLGFLFRHQYYSSPKRLGVWAVLHSSILRPCLEQPVITTWFLRFGDETIFPQTLINWVYTVQGFLQKALEELTLCRADLFGSYACGHKVRML
jgi:hypothetical protein